MSQKAEHMPSLLITASNWGMFSIGILISSLGPLLVSISNSFQLKLAQIGLPVVFNSLGFFSATLVVALLWQISRTKLLLTLSSLFLSASLMGIALLRTDLIIVFLVLLFFAGFGAGLLHTSLDALFSRVSGKMRTKYLNLLHMFVSLGAFASPLLIGTLLTYGENWYLFFLLMGLFNIPLPIFFCTEKSYNKFSLTGKFVEEIKFRGQMRWKLFLSIIFGVFLYVGVESSFASWMPVFLVKVKDIHTATASFYISIFWLAMVVGRWAFSRFFHKSDLSHSLILGGSVGTLSLTLSFLSMGKILPLLFIAFTGLAFSFIYPSLLASGGTYFQSLTGFVMGILTASGFCGSMVFTWLVGLISQAMGLATGVLTISLIGVGLVSTAICMSLLAKSYRIEEKLG